MQAEPYLIVNGTVVASRRVDVPARPSETRTGKDGSPYETRATDAYSYLEVAVNADATIGGNVADDLRAILTVRLELGDTLPDDGSEVSYAVTAKIAKAYIRGRFVEWVTYHRALDLTGAAVKAVTPPARLASTGS